MPFSALDVADARSRRPRAAGPRRVGSAGAGTSTRPMCHACAAGARRDANAMTVRDARDGLHATVRRTINVRDATGRGREAAHGARRAAPRG